jgi:hypothetical protein
MQSCPSAAEGGAVTDAAGGGALGSAPVAVAVLAPQAEERKHRATPTDARVRRRGCHSDGGRVRVIQSAR